MSPVYKMNHKLTVIPLAYLQVAAMEAGVEEVARATHSRKESALEAQAVDFPTREEVEEEVS